MAAADRIAKYVSVPQNRRVFRRMAGLGMSAVLMVTAPHAWSQSSGQGPSAESQLDALHHALNLSHAQEGAWQAYRAQAIAPAQAQDRRTAASQMFPNLTSPQRMDLVEAEMKQELLDLERQSQALKAFYAALSPQQKSVFDAQTLPREDAQQQYGQ